MTLFSHIPVGEKSYTAFPCADRALYNAWFNLWFLHDSRESTTNQRRCPNSL
jgi:hypothetical protein